jgi:hypothetical protein
VGDRAEVRHHDVGIGLERPFTDADDPAHAGGAAGRDA